MIFLKWNSYHHQENKTLKQMRVNSMEKRKFSLTWIRPYGRMESKYVFEDIRIKARKKYIYREREMQT